MKSITQSLSFLFLISILTLTTSCGKEEINPTDFGVFMMQDANTIVMNGVIDSDISQYWDNIIAAHPNITRMIMEDCPGSSDDEANLEAARKIRQQDIEIHLPANAEIASGAVDLFLAGTTRTREPGSKIGVHAWADGDDNEATIYPVGHEEHLQYIEYFQEMGFSLADAEAFYYFTINIAPHTDIHWMTDAEIEQYKLLTE